MDRESVLIEADELLARSGDGDLRIFDATIMFYVGVTDLTGKPTAHDVYRQGHIPGAAFFDHYAVSDAGSKYEYMALPPAELGAYLGSIGIGADTEVVLYATEMLPAATRAWWVLRYAGANNVRILHGGLPAWVQAGGQVERGERLYEPVTFTGQARPELFVNKDDVLAALGDEGVRTVHTLPTPMYAQAHIVGSTCLPCTTLMRADWSYFLPDDELASALQAEAQNERIITYCGGGIAATVNAIAHLLVGNEHVAVYDGSMYEWVGEGLPVGRAGGEGAGV